LPPQAQAANTEALDQVSETALAAANGNARFNRPGAGSASLEGQAGVDSVNGMQAESESLFKTAMESVQGGKAGAPSDAADLAALKVDTSSVAARAADAKAAEAQTQNGVKPYVSSLGLPIDDIEWSNQLGQKLMWMNARNIQTAELHLNPADLGPIDVRIQVGAEQSSISFNTQNQSVRELLEANIHRLREMMNNTGQSDNSQSGGEFAQHSGSESQGQPGGDSVSHRSLGGSSPAAPDGDVDSSSRPKPAENSLVDAYV
jgi:flagellar hook-length control protein FliK